jgi:hypothetical protein
VERKGRIERVPDRLFEGEESVLHLRSSAPFGPSGRWIVTLGGRSTSVRVAVHAMPFDGQRSTHTQQQMRGERVSKMYRPRIPRGSFLSLEPTVVMPLSCVLRKSAGRSFALLVLCKQGVGGSSPLVSTSGELRCRFTWGRPQSLARTATARALRAPRINQDEDRMAAAQAARDGLGFASEVGPVARGTAQGRKGRPPLGAVRAVRNVVADAFFVVPSSFKADVPLARSKVITVKATPFRGSGPSRRMTALLSAVSSARRKRSEASRASPLSAARRGASTSFSHLLSSVEKVSAR